MGGVRTPLRQFSSCVLIEAGDSLDQINAANAAIVKYVAQRAGIGFNFGMIRALGSTIRNGSANHTGVIPFLQMFQKAVKCCSQGGLRGGSATGFYPIWHLDVESLLVLKNNRGVEENRVRHIDYGVQISNLFYRRLIRNENITLFSPNAVPGMYDAFFADQGRFEKLYLAAEADPTIRKKSIPAMTLFSLFAQETMSTARIYIQNVDHCNTHSPFKPEIAPVRQSNLCLEIALPTKPLDHVYDADGEVALCTLSAFNMGNVTIDELPELADLIVRALDALLDYQDYPLPAAKRSTMYRRTLGVGVINYANWIAKNGFRYSDGSAKNATFEWFEAMQYSLMRASMVLAKEQGPCPGFHETRMSDGIMPFDTANQNAKDLVSVSLKQDWDSLRKDIMQYGMRNSTLSALMPSESSSQVSNATNGIEPPRGLLSIKGSKDGQLRQIVPDIRELGDKYELLWDIPDNNGYIELVAIMQIFICQAISANLNYDPSKYANENVPLKVILGHMLKMAKLGCKTRYYCNTRDNVQKVKTAEPVVVESDCPDGACKI
jgi:ribonucleoside-diphosphate reductase alpha chain